MADAPLHDPLVREVLDGLLRVADPLRVLLFGSPATGTARPDSDIDLLVVLPDGTDRRKAMVDIDSKLPRPLVQKLASTSSCQHRLCSPSMPPILV